LGYGVEEGGGEKNCATRKKLLTSSDGNRALGEDFAAGQVRKVFLGWEKVVGFAIKGTLTYGWGGRHFLSTCFRGQRDVLFWWIVVEYLRARQAVDVGGKRSLK